MQGSPSVFAIRHSVILLLDCHETSQSVDEGISKTTFIKKTLETSYEKTLNPVY